MTAQDMILAASFCEVLVWFNALPFSHERFSCLKIICALSSLYISFLFWRDWGTAAIERCTLAGSDRKALITSNIVWPSGITVDYTNKRLYWIDAHYDTITSIDYNGGQRIKIFEDTSLDVSPFHGFDLDIISDILYWTDWSQNSIYGLKQTKPSGTVFRSIPIQSNRSSKGVMGVVAVHSSRQPTGNNL